VITIYDVVQAAIAEWETKSGAEAREVLERFRGY
jgi:hypothetical protein